MHLIDHTAGDLKKTEQEKRGKKGGVKKESREQHEPNKCGLSERYIEEIDQNELQKGGMHEKKR